MKKRIGCILLVCCMLLPICGCRSQTYSKAEALYEAGSYAEALEVYETLTDGDTAYKLSGERVLACRYQLALQAEADGSYKEAEAMFFALGKYEDSATHALFCQYKQALALEDAAEYDKAAELYLELGSYSDSSERLNSCRLKQAAALMEDGSYDAALLLLEDMAESDERDLAIKASKYGKAKALMEAKEYEAARTLFGELDDYKDCQKLARSCGYLLGDQLIDAGEFAQAQNVFSELGDTEYAMAHGRIAIYRFYREYYLENAETISDIDLDACALVDENGLLLLSYEEYDVGENASDQGRLNFGAVFLLYYPMEDGHIPRSTRIVIFYSGGYMLVLHQKDLDADFYQCALNSKLYSGKSSQLQLKNDNNEIAAEEDAALANADLLAMLDLLGGFLEKQGFKEPLRFMGFTSLFLDSEL